MGRTGQTTIREWWELSLSSRYIIGPSSKHSLNHFVSGRKERETAAINRGLGERGKEMSHNCSFIRRPRKSSLEEVHPGCFNILSPLEWMSYFSRSARDEIKGRTQLTLTLNGLNIYFVEYCVYSSGITQLLTVSLLFSVNEERSLRNGGRILRWGEIKKLEAGKTWWICNAHEGELAFHSWNLELRCCLKVRTRKFIICSWGSNKT